MRKLLILLSVPLFLLIACSEEPPATSEPSDDAIIEGETRLVENPPTYESVPLPEGLEWVTNEEDPVFSSTEAKRGGTYNTYMLSFPLTLRMIGPDSNGAFASILRPNNMMAPLAQHPDSLNFIPQLATHWAFHPDGKTVTYRLNPDVRWSDGMPLTADDFLFTVDYSLSEFTIAPYYQDYFGKVVVNVVKHDDYTISIEGATAKPQNEIILEYGIWPTPRHFHKLDENWVQDYNWRVEPNLGPYQVSRVEKGRFIEFQRKDDWWGDELKYHANRFNPDNVRVTVIRDMNVAFEYFLRGELDSFPVVMPNYWHEKAQGESFDMGYIHKIKFYTDTPQPSQGMWLNMDDPILADQNVRYGLAHAMNIERLLSTLLRGDYERLRMHYEGYWEYSHPDIEAREFDLELADHYLELAGWTERGPDGIRTRDGQRLALSVVYGTQEHSPRLVLLREEAKKAGIELNLQLMDSSAYFKQILEKKHQIAWMGWSIGLIPTFWQHYHSDNAHKPQTNNITNTDNAELDGLIMDFRAATDKETRVSLAHQIQQTTHDIGMFIPTYKVPYTREAYWRWLKLPERYGSRTVELLFDPMTESTFWIDEDTKTETFAARDDGIGFDPVIIEDRTWRVE